MLVDELDYDLPPDRIATHPAEPRDAARLMVVYRQQDRIEHHRVRDLPQLADALRPGDLLVFNETRVLPARFAAVRAGTGGRVEGLYLQSPDQQRWLVLLESRGTLRPGETIRLSDEAALCLIEARGGGEWLARLDSTLDTLSLLDQIGSPPLPPYIRRQRRRLHENDVQPDDRQRYNTVYAREPGSVAAPTAGLHFTPDLLAALSRQGIEQAMLTLHVGQGTFAPIRANRIEDHAIHSEWMRIPAATNRAIHETRQRGGRIVPVGTTSVRALESLPPLWSPGTDYTGSTSLFILPPGPGRAGFDFRFTDRLMTNFHLPRSTLLCLVAALPGVGLDRLKRWYRVAVEEGYRFYSYGDAMLIV